MAQRSQHLSLCLAAVLKSSPYVDIKLLCLYFLVLWDCRVQLLFGNRVALNPGLGGVRDVASFITSHEQSQSHLVCCFQTLNAAFTNDFFFFFFFFFFVY